MEEKEKKRLGERERERRYGKERATGRKTVNVNDRARETEASLQF